MDEVEEPDDAIQRWAPKRRAALVVSILNGETSVAEAARRTITEWIRWSNAGRPQHTLGYLSPRQYRARQLVEAV